MNLFCRSRKREVTREDDFFTTFKVFKTLY